MAILRSPSSQLLCALHLLLISAQVFSYQYKVGDLDAWGIPAESDSQVYAQWSKYHSFKLGDSLLFLYPPSQDSVVQVTRQAYDACNVTDPILYMSDGNSLFNATSPGVFYFTSGAAGHCEKKQKLQISVLYANGSAYSPSASDGPGALPDISPSYPTVFGSIPVGSSSAHSRGIPALAVMAIGLIVYATTDGGSWFM
ncbi:early nodulin-like protein 1 [Rhodamnia argentea]|uniref:Early nodulin-like protein 1 n=1 Tax=Rhodamnia argentea TaxID=178133 RepID=A0A8B8PZK7_9MYRT|nr:early nodulin-like protein 1 [Rhodamnia argentea]XP_048132856.1 early nodulin-like protein 1 [Rhodamnia argentea]